MNQYINEHQPDQLITMAASQYDGRMWQQEKLPNIFLELDIKLLPNTMFLISQFNPVMISNVIGMGLNADDGVTATKLYIASANYINKMSNYCKSCHFNKKDRTGDKACPFNFLYWNFLLEHEEKLRSNPRLGKNVLALRYLDNDERELVRQQAQGYLENL